MAPRLPRVFIVTDPQTQGVHWLSRTEAAIRAGAPALLLRAKALQPHLLHAAARSLQKTCTTYGAQLWIHSDHALATELGAAGVHFGSHARHDPALITTLTLQGTLTTRACHTLEDVQQAEACGYTGAILSPVFSPTSKPHDTRPTFELSGLAEVVRQVGIPVLALGGLNPRRLSSVRRAGAYGAVVLGFVWSEDESAAVRRLVAVSTSPFHPNADIV